MNNLPKTRHATATLSAALLLSSLLPSAQASGTADALQLAKDFYGDVLFRFPNAAKVTRRSFKASAATALSPEEEQAIDRAVTDAATHDVNYGPSGRKGDYTKSNLQYWLIKWGGKVNGGVVSGVTDGTKLPRAHLPIGKDGRTFLDVLAIKGDEPVLELQQIQYFLRKPTAFQRMLDWIGQSNLAKGPLGRKAIQDIANQVRKGDPYFAPNITEELSAVPLVNGASYTVQVDLGGMDATSVRYFLQLVRNEVQGQSRSAAQAVPAVAAISAGGAAASAVPAPGNEKAAGAASALQ